MCMYICTYILMWLPHASRPTPYPPMSPARKGKEGGVCCHRIGHPEPPALPVGSVGRTLDEESIVFIMKSEFQ